MTANMGSGLLLVALALLILTAGDVGYWARRIWRIQSRQRPWLRRLSLRRFLRRGRGSGRFQATLSEIRDFLVSLQLALSMEETLGGALARTAEQFAKRGIFGQRLQQHVQSKLTISPEEVIKGLAEDFDSEQLRNAVTRLTLARDGGMSYVEAMALSVEAIENEIRAEIEHEIQRAPVILTIPMVMGVFLAALVLAAYPLVTRLIGEIAQ
jgi:hypothetical protein